MDHYLHRIVGSLGTLVTAYFSINFELLPVAHNVILLLICGYVGILLGVDACRAYLRREKSFDRTTKSGRKKIADYICAQLSASGSVCIFSKDLTWVSEFPFAEAVLLEKSGKGELSLYVETETKLTNKLSTAGATVRLYSGQRKKGFSPKSRFTILDATTGGMRVIVGSPSDGKHYIRKYDKPDFEVVDLAGDFVSLLNCTARKLR